MEKQEKKERKILTDNRMATVNKREMSFEGLIGQLENGEDGIYNLIANDKNVIFQPKISISKKDLEDIPFLAQLRESIERWETMLKTASGRDAFIIKKTLIEMRKDQYQIKTAYRKPIVFNKLTRNVAQIRNMPWSESINPITKKIETQGASFLDPNVICFILCNYSRLKEESWDQFQGDMWYIMQSFDELADKALKGQDLYNRIIEYKVDGRSNLEIQEMIQTEFGFTHSLEYISSLWRNKIPKMIASVAVDDWLEWHYMTEERGVWKRCSRCGETKLAHTRFFSINKTSRDGYYSICKKCRNSKKTKGGKEK